MAQSFDLLMRSIVLNFISSSVQLTTIVRTFYTWKYITVIRNVLILNNIYIFFFFFFFLPNENCYVVWDNAAGTRGKMVEQFDDRLHVP